MQILQDNPYVQDILEQPVALERTLAGLRAAPGFGSLAARITSGRIDRVVLTGMGSSFYGFYSLYYPLVRTGLPVMMLETSELLYYAPSLLRPETLVIVASQSGESAEVIRLLEVNRQRSLVLGITNNTASVLGQEAHELVAIHAGAEATVSSKTYVTMQLVMPWLAETLFGRSPRVVLQEMEAAPPAAAAYLTDMEAHVDWLAVALAGARGIFYLGRGPSLAAACTAGLITKESTRFPAEGMSSAAFRHGPLEMIREEIPVVIFGGDAPTRHLNLRLAADIASMGGRVLLVRDDCNEAPLRLPAAAACLLPVLEILPVQMITLAMAQISAHTAGAFERATKVTRVE